MNVAGRVVLTSACPAAIFGGSVPLVPSAQCVCVCVRMPHDATPRTAQGRVQLLQPTPQLRLPSAANCHRKALSHATFWFLLLQGKPTLRQPLCYSVCPLHARMRARVSLSLSLSPPIFPLPPFQPCPPSPSSSYSLPPSLSLSLSFSLLLSLFLSPSLSLSLSLSLSFSLFFSLPLSLSLSLSLPRRWHAIPPRPLGPPSSSLVLTPPRALLHAPPPSTQDRIIEQLKKLGCSCDWSRKRFTMDEECNVAVRALFKRMFDEGLIYRGDYLVNWDPVTQTALADDEVTCSPYLCAAPGRLALEGGEGCPLPLRSDSSPHPNQTCH